nr:relaxase/mobilization nuclease domain-containing protein [Pelobium sp.]
MAKLIGGNGFHKDLSQLDFNEKLMRLQDLASKNERVKTNTLHISLNFANGEKLDKEKLNAIAKDYMERIGFGKQPYLIYQHLDAGHPHVHIVTTNIQASGERISLHNLGKTKSEEARKIIETEYDLIPASKLNKPQDFKLNKVKYGKCETKRAITNVVKGIISSYQFTNLPEFNAVLKNYNVVADRGAKESRMYNKNGLVYWALDAKGNKVGVPIKASSIYGSPTLKKLENYFAKNKELRRPFKSQLQSKIDQVMNLKASQAGFKQAMSAKNIEVVFRQHETGKLYGVTFIDHQNRTVFKGSDLGKTYSASALESYFNKVENIKTDDSNRIERSYKIASIKSNISISGKAPLIDSLFEPEFQDAPTFENAQRKQRKKRRKNQIH